MYTNRGNIDYDYWEKRDSWTIQEAIILSWGYEPPYLVSQAEPDYISALLSSDNLEAYINYITEKYKGDPSQRPLSAARTLIKRIKMIQHGMEEGTLPYKYKENLNRDTVKPADFICFALQRGLPVPERFQSMVQGLGSPTDKVPPYLDTNNDNFAPELSIAIDSWERIYSDPDAIKDNKGHIDQIKAWLTKNHPELSNEAKERIARVINIRQRKRGGSLPIEPLKE